MTDFPGKTRIIRHHASDAAQWLPPDMNGKTQAEEEGMAPLLTAAQLEEMTQQAHREGYEHGQKEGFEYGHREGIEAGRNQLLERVEKFDQILTMLEKPFQELDDQVENEIVTLVVAMVRQLVRREMHIDAAQIVGVVRETLAVLPVSARRIRVLLHPEDAELVREAYTLGESDQKWQIVEDPVIQRGGCRVFTENSQIDATLESRLNSLIAPLLADERGADS